MGSPILPPRVVVDAKGKPRLKLKRGRGTDELLGPHVHYVSGSGVRTDQSGRPIPARSRRNFRKITWDLPEAPPQAAAGPVDVAAALVLARRSPTFARLLDEVLRSGWVIDLAGPGFGAGSRKGPHTISLDAHRRGAFVARMVHEVAYARALADPLPLLDVAAPGFPREDAVFLLRKWGEAALAQATARDEILLAGGPDIGGPGLRGLQLDAYDVQVRQSVARERVLDAIGLSVDGLLVQGFSPTEGPHVAMNLARAFVPPAAIVSTGLTAEMLQLLEHLRRLPAFDAVAVGHAFGVELAPRPLGVDTPYLDVKAALLESGPFSWVELRTPVRGVALAPRLLLVPRYEMSHFDLASWFGLGVPHHVDPLPLPGAVATAAYPFERREMYVTYSVSDLRTVTFFTLHGN